MMQFYNDVDDAGDVGHYILGREFRNSVHDDIRAEAFLVFSELMMEASSLGVTKEIF